MQKPHRTVDIIIPVYNGRSLVERCIRSIVQRTADIDYRIIAVDDGSTDAGTVEYLRSCADGTSFIVLRSSANRGFVYAANRGMRFSDRDVVLLNTDTEVTEGWLDNLRKTAYASSSVASVTPVSTAASIYSVLESPSMTQYAKTIGTEAVQRIVNRVSHRKAPEIPVGVGFCMYIKRAALDAVGFFDPAFGRGYGEECDWCLRARQLGWRHVLEDGTFIAHEGGATMRATGDLAPGEISVPEHERLLEERYPYFRAQVQEFIAKDRVLPELRERLARTSQDALARGRTRITFILHAPPSQNATGGTELHVHDLIEGFRGTCDVLALYPCPQGIAVERFVGNTQSTWTVPLVAGDYDQTMHSILTLYPSDIVHVHHVLGIGFGILPIAKRTGARVLYSLHDYYAVSPNYTLTDRHGRFQGIPHALAFCPNSWRTHAQWRASVRESLQACDAVIAPSAYALRIFASVFQDVPCAKYVVAHGIAGERYTVRRAHPCVCFLGHVHQHAKGRSLVSDVIRRLACKGIASVVLGSDASAFPEVTSPLARFLGPYQRKDLRSKLSDICPHMIALLSTYPETFCYALSECWQAGLPAYVSPIGALRERMEETGGGWIAPDWNAEIIAEDIAGRLAGPDYKRMLDYVQALALPTQEEMLLIYRNIYRMPGNTRSASLDTAGRSSCMITPL